MKKKGRVPTARIPKKPRVKRPAPIKNGKYMGLEYESFCEISCLYFAEELIKMGYVDRIERSPSYLLCNPVQHTYVEQLKRSSKQVTQTISQGCSYTPDYDIYFTQKARGIFFWELGSNQGKWDKNLLVAQKELRHPTLDQNNLLYRASCEVKPDFSRNSTTPKSVQSMKWLYQKHGVYINLFRPNNVFEGLFVPKKYLLTEKGKPRLLKFKPLTLQEYLNKHNGKTGRDPVAPTKRTGKGKHSGVQSLQTRQLLL